VGHAEPVCVFFILFSFLQTNGVTQEKKNEVISFTHWHAAILTSFIATHLRSLYVLILKANGKAQT
jgi:hypothetical protein